MNDEQIDFIKRLYKSNFKFIVRDKDGELIAFKELPEKSIKHGCWLPQTEKGLSTFGITWTGELFSITWDDEPIDIMAELGLLNWETIPENTPVYVRRCYDDKWKPRLFHKYKENASRPFICYWGGLSKHTIQSVPPGEPRFTAWEQCKLAD